MPEIMPELNGLVAHVTSEGENLAEWGTQHLWRVNKVSSYIQSNTNQTFQISIEPRLPWKEVQAAPSEVGTSSNYTRPTNTRSDTSRKTEDSSLPSFPDSLPSISPNAVPRYSFLARVFLDGRKYPDRRSLIYLDPSHANFPMDGIFRIRPRWVNDVDGNMREHQWVFKERAIESALDRLDLNLQDPATEDVEASLTRSLTSTAIEDMGEEMSQSDNKAGQIFIVLERVILGLTYVDYSHRSVSRTSRGDDSEMGEAGKDVTHTTSLIGNDVVIRDLKRVTDVTPYKPGEGNFATFQFFYRSGESLAKMGFRGFPQALNPPVSISRRLNSRIADLTRLSFFNSQEQPESEKPAKTTTSYEAKVLRKSFKREKAKEILIHGEYRDSNKSTELENSTTSSTEERELIPKNSWNLRSSTPRVLGPLPTIKETDCPSLTTKAAASTKRSAPSGNNRNQDRRRSSRLRDITKQFSPLDHHRSRTSSSPSPPSPIHGGRSSSGPSTDKLSKENLDLHNLAAKGGFRSMDHEPNIDANVDDEAATESDLETDAGDLDEGEYALNPEENDETHNGLRSRLRDVALGKRHHGDFEADGEAMVGEGGKVDEKRVRTSG